jgi:hypothetical protein
MYQTQTEEHMKFISTCDLCATVQSSVANTSVHTSYIMQQIKVFVRLIFRLMEENARLIYSSWLMYENQYLPSISHES